MHKSSRKRTVQTDDCECYCDRKLGLIEVISVIILMMDDSIFLYIRQYIIDHIGTCLKYY